MTKPHFPIKRYNEIVKDTITQLKALGELKGREYAGTGDRLGNFRRHANATGLPMETIWRIYAAKDWDALMQYEQDMRAGITGIKRLETLASRCDDIIVYLLLFKCMLEERETQIKLPDLFDLNQSERSE